MSDVKDEINFAREAPYALIYLMSSIRDGIVTIHPGIHGLYETELAANIARQSKINPKDYYICKSYWRNLN